MNTNQLKILVVEDDDFQRRMIVSMLRSLELTSLYEASNGKQALEVIREEHGKPVDIAICDLQMPEMDGLEFLRHLSQDHPNISIIIISALNSKLLTSVVRMAKTYGIKLLGSIEKPIALSDIKELFSKYGNTDKKWNQATVAFSFTLDEILQGIRKNQFEPFFQPKVNLKTGRLIGAEALARWIHPEHGVVGPAAFIPLLEQSGNIDDLTFLMLEKSAAACRSFHSKGHTLSISVNLSLASLDNSALADKITQIIRKAGVDPQYIELEITESVAMTDVAHALENLARLCMNGFTLSIDDYGTGYSSLQQLTRIAFGELKIDQSFVKDLADNESLRIVVESSIDMAHKLQVKSVAEGVESQQDFDVLRSMGCDFAQGYFIAKPMNIDAFYDFMVNNNHKTIGISLASFQDQSKKNILVVEDDDFTRKLILQVLHDLGFVHITEGNSAESAIKLLESCTFDLIITDIQMAGMNGLKFVQLIRTGKTHAKPESRIVVLTALSSTWVLSAALALDINGFLVKPIVPAILGEKLTQALSEKLHLHPKLAYESVKTESTGITSVDDRQSNPHRGPAITLGVRKTSSINERVKVHHLSLQELRPGMILHDGLHFSDGTLLLSPGHIFTDISINRTRDLRSLLQEHDFVVQAMAKDE